MNNKVYLFIFDGFADWEPALALCEINKSGLFEVCSAGFSKDPIVSMGGLKTSPEINLEEIEMDKASLVILPGGEMWLNNENKKLRELIKILYKKQIPLAAICGATVELARAGLLNTIQHTSNSLSFLSEMASKYKGADYYQERLAVSDHNLITASGLGYVEFASEIFKLLGILSQEDNKVWFDAFKKGVNPG